MDLHGQAKRSTVHGCFILGGSFTLRSQQSYQPTARDLAKDRVGKCPRQAAQRLTFPAIPQKKLEHHNQGIEAATSTQGQKELRAGQRESGCRPAAWGPSSSRPALTDTGMGERSCAGGRVVSLLELCVEAKWAWPASVTLGNHLWGCHQ